MHKLVLFIALLGCSLSQAAVLDVQALNKKLQKTGAGWVAKSTPIGSLAKEDAARMMGLNTQEAADVSFEVPSHLSPFALPQSVDWRNKDGLNWVTPILDQAYCGSCVAFATVATLETQYKISSGFAGLNIKLSPQHLFACGGGACHFGWFPEAASRYLQRSGVPDEACMPYTSGATGEDMECKQSCSDASQRSVKIAAYSTPSRSAKDVDSVKAALQKGPLVTTLMVYADFMYYASGVYKHMSGELMGGHAVSIVGYDDTLRAFIIRNSWGTSWGENGFGYVSYDDVSGIGDSTWSYNMPAVSGVVTVEDPIDYTYVTNSAPVKVHSTFSNTDSVTVSFFDHSNQAVWSATCNAQDCEQPADVSNLADGRYEVQARAMDKSGQLIGQSPRQFFYVVNHAPSLTLSFTGTNGTDLDRPVKNIVEVSVHGTSSSVPMSSVEFHRVGPDGKDSIRTASVVVDGLVMGWRTNLVPNGTYDTWMTGKVTSNNGMVTVVESAHKSLQIAN